MAQLSITSWHPMGMSQDRPPADSGMCQYVWANSKQFRVSWEVSGGLKKIQTCFLFVGNFWGSYLGDTLGHVGPFGYYVGAMLGHVSATPLVTKSMLYPRPDTGMSPEPTVEATCWNNSKPNSSKLPIGEVSKTYHLTV